MSQSISLISIEEIVGVRDCPWVLHYGLTKDEQEIIKDKFSLLCIKALAEEEFNNLFETKQKRIDGAKYVIFVPESILKSKHPEHKGPVYGTLHIDQENKTSYTQSSEYRGVFTYE